MKALLKYIIPIFIVVLLSDATDKRGDLSCQPLCHEFPIEEVTCYESFTSSISGNIIAACNVESPCSTRLQGNDGRTDYTHRHLLKLVKFGKVSGISAITLLQRDFVLVSTAVTEHVHKLVFLGRLII